MPDPSSVRDAEERGLDLAQPLDVARGCRPRRRCRGTPRRGARSRSRAWPARRAARTSPARTSSSISAVILATKWRLDDARARGDDPERCRLLLLEELAQRRGLGQAAVHAVEGVEQRRGASPARLGAGGVEQRVAGPDEDLADQALARAEPAVDRCCARVPSSAAIACTSIRRPRR